MKKSLSMIMVACLAIMMMSVSCKKDANNSTKQQYAKFVSGEVIIKNGDVSLKAVPVGVIRYLYMYKGVVPTLALVDGSEFLAGSAPNIFWSTSGNNPGNFPATQQVYSNFTPAMQIRMVAKTVDASAKPAYLGIWDGLPAAGQFPVTIYGKRLGDVLTLNADDLTALPGYTNMSFTVSYDKGMINVENTALTSGPTTATNWPTYTYSSTVNVIDQAVTGSGNRIVYDDVDAKILGTITIKIHVDATTITVTTPASALGSGLALKLTTTKKGWFDSATMSITDDPITVVPVNIPVN